jgi:DNA-binding CsgD family transcriptional regulator
MMERSRTDVYELRSATNDFSSRRLGDQLVGRDRAFRFVAQRLVDLTRNGAAIVVRGEPGIGMSSQLAATVVRAERQGVKVGWVAGVRSERRLPFAGLHQILQAILATTEGLSDTRCGALLESFAGKRPSKHDIFLTAMATLELLAEAGRRAPLVLAVDDAHWFDPASAHVLGLVARRLYSVRALILMAVRDGFDSSLLDYSLTELRLEPLDEESSGRLLELIAADLEPELRSRVLAAAAGNPLALVELPRALRSKVVAGLGFPDELPVTDRLQQAIVEPFSSLSSPTRLILTVASADEEADLGEIVAAAQELNDRRRIAPDDLEPAVGAGIVHYDNKGVSFDHPLMKAAIYRAATPSERLRAHEALARVLTGNPPRRAWHFATSATETSEDLASEIERASEAQASPTNRLAALERAAQLTPELSKRVVRFLHAAERAAEMGRPERARQLLAEVAPENCDALGWGRLRLIREMISPGLPGDPRTVGALVDAASVAALAHDAHLALRLLLSAAMHCWWGDPGPAGRRQVSDAALRIRGSAEDPMTLSIAAICHPAQGWEALSEFGAQTSPGTLDPQTAHFVGTALQATGAFELATAFLAEAAAALREQGQMWLLPQTLTQLAWTAIYTGNASVASEAACEAAVLAERTQQAIWVAGALSASSTVASLRGDSRQAHNLLRDAEAIALPLGASAVLCDIQLSRALLALSHGEYDEAYDHLKRTYDPCDLAFHPFRSAWHIGEFSEASVHAGHRDQAREHLGNLEALLNGKPCPRVQIGILYARPLLAEDDEAEQEFGQALQTNLTRWPIYRARLQLEYGTWLRRHRRVSDARMPLRASRDAFQALGASPWAERARHELRAAGERTSHDEPAGNALTAQELHIAQLAAEGLTNREIGKRLFLSHRTVSTNLYRIFPKLGITTRSQLGTLIEDYIRRTDGSSADENETSTV